MGKSCHFVRILVLFNHSNLNVFEGNDKGTTQFWLYLKVVRLPLVASTTASIFPILKSSIPAFSILIFIV